MFFQKSAVGAHNSCTTTNCTVGEIKREGTGRGTKNVTLNSKSVTEIISKLPDNLNGPVLPYRMTSF